MNPANSPPAPLTPLQPSRATPTPGPHDDPSPDPRELTAVELLAVAGGPIIVNGSD